MAENGQQKSWSGRHAKQREMREQNKTHYGMKIKKKFLSEIWDMPHQHGSWGIHYKINEEQIIIGLFVKKIKNKMRTM